VCERRERGVRAPTLEWWTHGWCAETDVVQWLSLCVSRVDWSAFSESAISHVRVCFVTLTLTVTLIKLNAHSDSHSHSHPHFHCDFTLSLSLSLSLLVRLPVLTDESSLKMKPCPL